MGNETVDVKTVRGGGGTPCPPTPFHIILPVQVVTDEIDVGDESTTITLDRTVEAVQNAFVLLNAASCWNAPTGTFEGALSAFQIDPTGGADSNLEISADEILLNPVLTSYQNSTQAVVIGGNIAVPPYTGGPISITGVITPDATNDHQSNGAWWEWGDGVTPVSPSEPSNQITVHRGSTCGDCDDNCVAFTVQVVELVTAVVEIPS